jgi:hypothetical protein
MLINIREIINIPLFTIPPVEFTIVDVVDPTVDVVDLFANINKNIINFNATNVIYMIYY